MTTSSNALLRGVCLCGEPIFRHRRPDGRQITCEQLRRIDQQFFESGAQATHQPDRQFQIVSRGSQPNGGVE